jgi:adenine-specific DNA-methyltransferase
MENKYPKLNYIGNKEKISEWICSFIPEDATSIFDAFSGGSSVGYIAKCKGLAVYSNDILSINYHIAKALIENKEETLTPDDIETIFEGNPIEGFMYNNYSDTYYFPNECKELDLYRSNINKLTSEYKQSLALILMRRAMIRKMPYSRFTIKWDKIVQLRDEEYSYRIYKRKRAYHNQSFKFHFLDNLDEYNNAVFDNGCINKAYNLDIFEALKEIKADVIYMDPPYAGTMCDYYGFYNLLDEYIAGEKLAPFDNNFIDRNTVINLFDKLFSCLTNFKYWILSYNSRSFPSKEVLLELLQKYSPHVVLHEMPYAYKVTGKEKKQKDVEYLFVVKNEK